MDKNYEALVSKSYSIKKINDGFSFRTTDDRPCELTIIPHLEIHKGEVLLTANYDLKVSGYPYTYGSSHGDFGEKNLNQFAEMYEILRNRYENKVEREKSLMYSFVESLSRN